jgi:hypothetical protein
VADTPPQAGFTVRDLAARWRVGLDKIRRWISLGDLVAVNVAGNLAGRPQWRVAPEAVKAFEARRAGGPPTRPARRHKRSAQVDFYPDS